MMNERGELAGLADIDKPIDHPYHDSAANDVSNSDRQQVGNKEIAPGQMWEI